METCDEILAASSLSPVGAVALSGLLCFVSSRESVQALAGGTNTSAGEARYCSHNRNHRDNVRGCGSHKRSCFVDA